MTSSIPWPYDLDDARACLDHAGRLDDREAVFAISMPDAGPIGVIGIELKGRGQIAELGYWLGEPWWNRGYASEAAEAVIAHAFQALGHDRMVARCVLGNEASRRLLIGAGFRPTGIDSCRSLSTGSSHVSQCFELTAREWQHLGA
jgi:RimJ/RimL family protein N-acetyltransferase